MAQYDEIVKHLMDRFADEFAQLAFSTTDVEVVAKLDTEQQTVKVHRNDTTFAVRRNDGEMILHIEAQTDDSRDKPMPLRVLAYASVLMLEYEMPVYSLVLYLGANAGRTDPGGYSYGDETFGLQHKYHVIRLADLEGEPFLDATSVGLLPFTPLMKPPEGMETETWLRRCIEATESAPVDNQTRGTLLFALSTLGSLVHDPVFFEKFISEEMMQESPFYEIIIQRGIEQGSREMSIKNILSVLTKRFPQQDMQQVAEALDAITSLDRLMQLIDIAVDTPSVETFLTVLNV